MEDAVSNDSQFTCCSITLLEFLWIRKWSEKTTTHLGKILGIKLNSTIPTPFKMEPTDKEKQE